MTDPLNGTESPMTSTVSAIRAELAAANDAVRTASDDHRRSANETARLATRLRDLENARDDTKRRLAECLSALPPVSNDPFGMLPDEVLVGVVQFLDVTEV